MHGKMFILQLLHDMQAVAGSDSNISLISIVEAQVVGLLQGIGLHFSHCAFNEARRMHLYGNSDINRFICT